MILKFPYSENTLNLVRQIPGRKWDGVARHWTVPDTQLSVEMARAAGIPCLDAVTAIVQHEHYVLSHVDPFAHQIQMSRLIMNCLIAKKGYCIFAEAGLGKTKAVLDAMRNHRAFEPYLVLCPAPTLSVWIDEATKHGMLVKPVHGPKRSYMNHNCDAIVTSYDTFAIDIAAKAPMPEFPAVFMDESQLVKNPSCKRHKAIRKVATPCKFAMTGTPYGNHWKDLWAQSYLVEPKAIGGVGAFHARYCEFGEYNEIAKYLHLDELKRIIAMFSISMRKSDCLDLPEKIYQTINLDMTAPQAAVYNRAKQGAYKDDPLSSILERIMAMRQISSGFKYDGPATDRLPCQKVEYLKSITWDTPTIIWVNFKEESASIVSILQSEDVPFALADGSHPASKAVSDFQSGAADVIVANYASVQYSFTLNRAARVIFFSPSFSQLQRSQSEDRCHRIGQDKNVLYIDLITSPVERYILECLQKHIDIKDELLRYFRTNNSLDF